MSLIEAGHADRVLIGNEIGWKTCYKAYGGWGYAHVLRPRGARGCATAARARRRSATILVENPARLHAHRVSRR